MSGYFYPQLSGVPTGGRDCGVSATRTAITWAARNKVRPTVKAIRRRMGDLTGWTDPAEWEKAIASYDTPRELAGAFEMIPVERDSGGPWAKAWAHLQAGGMALLAVDYGVLRRSAPRRTGSSSFDGYHAIAFRLDREGRLLSYDALLDGRRPGIPKGPVPIAPDKVRKAAEEVGRKELGRPVVFMVLVGKAIRLGGVIPGPEDEEPPTLAGILADLHEALDAADSGPVRKLIANALADLEAIIGPYQGEAEPDEEPEEGGVGT